MRYIGILPLLWGTIGCTGENVIDKQENSAPNIQIMSHATGVEVQDGYVEHFRATVSDDDNEFSELSIAWYVGENIVCDWTVANPAGESYCDIVFVEGDNNVIVEVRDPQGAGGRAEISVVVLPTEAPTIELFSPVQTTNYYSDQLILFSALVADNEDAPNDLLISWTSSIDGELPLDTSPDASGEISDYGYLSEGQHAIELQVEDSSGKITREQVLVRVGGENQTPECSITQPVELSAFIEGDSILFRGTATDANIPSTELTAQWLSDKDGNLGLGTINSQGIVTFSYAGLSANEHIISMIVTDEIGANCQATAVIYVGNPPTTTISEPMNGMVYDVGESIIFRANITDAEDNPNEISVRWESSLDGELYSAPANAQGISQFSRSNLSPGLHSISAISVDSTGLQSDDIISIRVNTPPVVNSITLSPDPVYANNNLVATASTSDADGHNVTASYAWYEDGLLTSFTGTTISASELDVGEVWTVRVTPDDGYSTGNYLEESITVANSLPTISSVSISPSTNVYHNTTLTCSAIATDADQSITPTYTWSVNGVNYAGTTLNLSSVTATPGDSITCTATATDIYGASVNSSASVTLSNTAPVVSNVSISPNSPNTLDIVTCSATATDIDGGNPILSFSFSNQTSGATYTPTSSTSASASLDLASVVINANDLLVCEATATDAQGYTDTDSTSITVINAAPVFSQTATISPAGDPTTDTTLTCSAVASDPAGGSVSYTYSWLLNGQSVSNGTSFVTSSSVTNVGDSIECLVLAINNNGDSSTSTSPAVTVLNSVPTVDSIALSPATVYTNTTISATASVSDLDGDVITATFEWHVVDAVTNADNMVSSGSGASYTSLAGSYFDRDDEVYVIVTPNDGHGNGIPVTSSSIIIQDTAPTAPIVALTSASNPPIEGTDDLECSITNTPSDLDGDVLNYTYNWYDDAGVLQQTYANTTDTSDTFLAAGTTPGTWTCEIIVSDGTLSSSATAQIVVNADWAGAITLTNCGKTGNTGPSQSQCDSEYLNTTFSGQITVTSGYQYWTVPSNGTYSIQAFGAKGGGSSGGNGASMYGEFNLQTGDVLTIVVGQKGINESYSRSYIAGGGGGGTFVTLNTTPLIIAGGGAGCGSDQTGRGGITAQSDGYTGSAGNGGSQGEGCGGAGFSGNGSGSAHSGVTIAQSFTNGATGGVGSSSGGTGYGGFGGGGCDGHADGGGGGGYSGGNGYGDGASGGGAGSYNSGSNQSNSAAANSGHGYVVINKL